MIAFFALAVRFVKACERIVWPDTLAARVLVEEHKTYARAVQLFADGRLEVVGRRVRVKA